MENLNFTAPLCPPHPPREKRDVRPGGGPGGGARHGASKPLFYLYPLVGPHLPKEFGVVVSPPPPFLAHR